MGWPVIARLTSFGFALAIAAPMALLTATHAGADATVTAANGIKTPSDDVGTDNPGSDDGDSGTNDDPVWGYFLGKTAYVFFHEIASAMRMQDGTTPIANTAAKRDQLASLLLVAESGKRFGGAVLGDAATGWILSWRQDVLDDAAAGAKPNDSTWDGANLTTTQMSDLLCMLYGSDATHFRGLVDNGDIKADAAAGCVENYRKVAAQWRTILDHAGTKLNMGGSIGALDAKPGSPAAGSTDETATAASASPSITLAQQRSTAPALADFTGWLSDVGLAGNLIAETNRDLTLAAPVSLVMLQCDKDSDPATSGTTQNGRYRLCYEWLKSGYDAATAQNVDAPPE